MNLYDTILKNADNHPNKTALVYYKRHISYMELAEKIKGAASALHKMGLRAGDTATLALPTTPESIAITYALNMIGVTVSFVDVRFTAKQVSKIARRTNSKFLFIMNLNIKAVAHRARIMDVEQIVVLRGVESLPKAVQFWYAAADRFNGRKLAFKKDKRFKYWNDIPHNGTMCDTPIFDWPQNSIQLIFQTSGTTGNSKSAVTTAENFLAPIDEALEMMLNDYNANDKFLCQLPIFNIHGFQCTVQMPLQHGNTIQIVPSLEQTDIIKIIYKYKPQHVLTAPINWGTIYDNENTNIDLSFLKTAIVFGDAIKTAFEKSINEWLNIHGHKYNLRKSYGMTESAGIIAYTSNSDNRQYAQGFSGKTCSCHRVRVFDGEICVLSGNKLLGYYDKPDDINHHLKIHEDGFVWLHTGDFGHFDKDGNLYVDGRNKRIFTRYDGCKISPISIEKKILEHPCVQACAVIAVPDKKHPQKLLIVAFVTTTDTNRKKEITEFVKRNTPLYIQPSKILTTEKFPLTEKGEINFKKLTELASSWEL